MAVIMEMLSERYGWLPSEIENEGAQDIADYIQVIAVKNILEKQELKRHGRK